MEDGAQQLELGVAVAEAVAVRKEEHFVAKLDGLWLVVYHAAALFRKVIAAPEVVVPDKEMYLHAGIGQLADLA